MSEQKDSSFIDAILAGFKTSPESQIDAEQGRQIVALIGQHPVDQLLGIRMIRAVCQYGSLASDFVIRVFMELERQLTSHIKESMESKKDQPQ